MHAQNIKSYLEKKSAQLSRNNSIWRNLEKNELLIRENFKTVL